MGRFREMFKWAEVKEREDVYSWRGTTDWGNHDLYPVDSKDRKFGFMGYAAYWGQCGACISTYTIASSYIALGLSRTEVICAVMVGSLMSVAVALLAGGPGAVYGIGYTVSNRMAFGMRGSYLPIFIVFCSGMIFAGLQAYFGGQAVTLMLGAIIPSFKFMENTLPESAAITTPELIGFMVYIVAYIPAAYFVNPRLVRIALYPSVFLTMTIFTALLIWSIVSNGGVGPSTVLGPTLELTTSQRALRFVQCASGVSGTFGGAADRYSDWSRFESKKWRSLPGVILLPITVIACAAYGVFITTATVNMYGVAIWNPVLLLEYILSNYYTPGVRAVTFFAGFAIYYCQIFMNLSQNSIPYGMDVSAAFPRYFDIRRAVLLLIAIILILQPWRFLSQAAIFVTILSAVTVYYSCATAITMTDYWIIRKQNLKIPDLFTEGGIYWFYKGWNLRCVIALVAGMLPSMPGFIMTCIDSEADNVAVNIFQVCWFVGAPLSFIIYYALNLIWPPPGLGIKEFISEESEVVEVIDTVGIEPHGAPQAKSMSQVTGKLE